MSKKKGAKRAKRGPASALLAEDPESPEELEPVDEDEDLAPTLAEAVGTVDDDEAISLYDLSEEEQAAYIESLRAEGRQEDADISQSRINAQRRRQAQRTAELHRLEPDEDEEGIPIGGIQRTFKPPFNDLSIREWTSRHLGGGKYEIQFYGDKHQWLGRERFVIPGLPKAWRKQRQLIEESENRVRRDTDRDLGQPSERESRLEAELEEVRMMLKAQARQREEDEKDRRHREEMEALRAEIRQVTTKKESNLPELITALGAAVAPVMEALSTRMSHNEDRRGETKEMLSEMRRAADDSRKQVLELLAATSSKPNAMEDAMSKMVNTIILERMKPPQDPQTFAYDILRKVIPHAVDSSLEMARVAQTGGGNDNMIERVLEMVSPLVERALPGATGQTPMLPQGAMPMGPQMPMAMPGYPYPQLPMRMPMQAPVQAPPQTAVPQAGQYPYSQARPVVPQPMPQPMSQPVQRQPAPMQPAPMPQPAPNYPVQPAQPQPVPPQPHVPQAPGIAPSGMPNYPAPGQPVQPAHALAPASAQPSTQPYIATAPTDQTNPITAHIDPNLFVMMRGYLAQGKSGDDLADDVDDQIESVRSGQQQGAPLLSEKAIEYVESYPPQIILMKLWDACPQQLLAEFSLPDGSVRPDVQEFALDFLHYFYDDEEEAEAGDAAASPATPGPVPPPTPAVPTAEGA